MKVAEIDKQIEELTKKKKRLLQLREAQRKFKAKRERRGKGDKFIVELKAERDGKICEVATLQEALEEIKHQIKMKLFEKDDIYIIRKNDDIIAEYDYNQAVTL